MYHESHSDSRYCCSYDVVNVGGPLQIFRNTSSENRWIGVQLTGPALNRMAVGGKVTVRCGSHQQVSTVMAGQSYLSQSDTRLHFGLPCSDDEISLKIVWPDGTSQSRKLTETNRYIRVEKRALR